MYIIYVNNVCVNLKIYPKHFIIYIDKNIEVGRN